jgi:outer membrane protein
MKRTFFVLCLVCFSAFAQEDQQVFTFSLQQAIDHALKNNYSAINAGRDIEIAEYKKWETTAAGLPQINAAVDYVDNFVLQRSLVPAEFFGGSPGDFIPVVFGTKHSMNARATLSQLLFDGSYIVALQASKTYLQYFRNAKKKSDQEVREAVINAYGNVLLAQESVTIFERNLSSIDKTLHETTQTFKQGLIEEENVEQLQITRASIVSNLQNARRVKEIALNLLKLSVGLKVADQMVLTDKLEGLALANMDAAIMQDAFDLKQNIDYKMGENFVEQRTLEMKREKSRALPSLSANLHVGYNAFSNDFTFAQGDQRWFHFSSLAINLNVPIFSSFGRRARTQQAKIEVDKAKTLLSETEQRLELNYQNAKSQFEFSLEELATAKNSLSLAERIERKQQVKFSEGLSSSFDFSEAQRQLYSSQQNYLQAMINVINRRATLENIISTNP